MKSIVVFVGLIFLLAIGFTGQAQDEAYIRADRLGITHISFGAQETPPERYVHALALGAGWNRWPLYWDWVETAPGEWDWSGIDRQVRGDLSSGLEINAILMGRPQFYQDGPRITGLYRPIFADNTDTPGAGKAINPQNPWANFVWQAVNRYKPGGELARIDPLPNGGGIRIWEIWNEPDYTDFWRASVRDYAQLLRVSYIVIKLADPEAQVMFGGLLYPTQNNWLTLVLDIFINDPLAEQYEWYMDIVAVHNYADPWRSGWLTLVARQSLVAYNIQKPIWVNETGVPVWDDYPGPVWDRTSLKHATQQQQAWFLIQSAAYAWSEGADKVFFHQLYDDCGNRPAGTDFRPHQGELCASDAPCFGDAHGIFRNALGALCFGQHPQPGTQRPVGRAYRLLAEIFGREAFQDGKREYLDDKVVTLTFERPRTNERITVMWNRTFEPHTFEYEAVGENGQLISLDSDSIALPDDDGSYVIDLPPAQPDNVPDPPPFADAAIGGSPYILIEKRGEQIRPVFINLDAAVVMLETPTAQIDASTQATSHPFPTTNPDEDTTPPQVTMHPLPARSTSPFRVQWQGADNSGIDHYLIWVRVDDGEWQPWLETRDTSAMFVGESGRTYEFAAWAVDLAGNWSDNANLVLQTGTKVD